MPNGAVNEIKLLWDSYSNTVSLRSTVSDFSRDSSPHKDLLSNLRNMAVLPTAQGSKGPASLKGNACVGDIILFRNVLHRCIDICVFWVYNGAL